MNKFILTIFVIFIINVNYVFAINKLDASKTLQEKSITENLLIQALQDKIDNASGGGSDFLISDRNAIILDEMGSTLPSSPSEGYVFLNTDDNNISEYVNGSWKTICNIVNDYGYIIITPISDDGGGIYFTIGAGQDPINFSSKIELEHLQGINIDSNTLGNKHFLMYDGSDWINKQIYPIDIMNFDNRVNLLMDNHSYTTTETTNLIADSNVMFKVDSITHDSNDTYTEGKIYLVNPIKMNAYNNTIITGYDYPSFTNEIAVHVDYDLTSQFDTAHINKVRITLPDNSFTTYEVTNITYDSNTQNLIFETTTNFTSMNVYNDRTYLTFAGGDYNVDNDYWLGDIFIYINGQRIILHDNKLSRSDFVFNYPYFRKRYTWLNYDIILSKNFEDMDYMLSPTDTIIKYPHGGSRYLTYDTVENKIINIRPFDVAVQIMSAKFTPNDETAVWDWTLYDDTNPYLFGYGGIYVYNPINRCIYFGMGKDFQGQDTIFDTFYKYDINENTVTTLSSPIVPTDYASAYLYNGNIYSIGGECVHPSITKSNTGTLYNTTNQYSVLTANSNNKLNSCYVFDNVNDDLYEIGGYKTSREMRNISRTIYRTTNHQPFINMDAVRTDVLKYPVTGAKAVCGSYINDNPSFYIFGGKTIYDQPIDHIQKMYYDSNEIETTWTCEVYDFPNIENFCIAQHHNNPDIIYIAGGNDDNDTVLNDLTKYDMSDTVPVITTLATMPVAVKGAQMIFYTGELYVLGGELSDGTYTDSVQIYDISNNSWSIASYLLKEPRAYFGACNHNNTVFISMGKNTNDTYTSDTYFLNLIDGTYGTIEVLNDESIYPYCYYDKSYYSGTYYSIGGYKNTTITGPSNMIQKYDISNDTWEVLDKTLPIYVSKFGMTNIKNSDNLYIYGGELSDGSITNEVFNLNKSDFTFDKKSNMPISVKLVDGMFNNGYIYTAGGNLGNEDDPNDDISDIYKYDIANNTWSSIGYLNKGEHDVEMFKYKNRLYFYQLTDDYNQPQYLDFSDDQIYDMEIQDSANIIYLYPYYFDGNIYMFRNDLNRDKPGDNVMFTTNIENNDYIIYSSRYADGSHTHSHNMNIRLTCVSY